MTDEYRAFLESRNNSPESDRLSTGDSLEHHGIPGMKWHKRRYQYENGRLTPEGKIRYGKGDGSKSGSKDDSETSNKETKKDSSDSRTLSYKKSARSMTEEELDQRIRRLQKETLYNTLRSTLKSQQPKTKAERRKEIRNTIFVATATTAAAAIMTQVYKKAAVWMVKKASGGKIDLGTKKS